MTPVEAMAAALRRRIEDAVGRHINGDATWNEMLAGIEFAFVERLADNLPSFLPQKRDALRQFWLDTASAMLGASVLEASGYHLSMEEAAPDGAELTLDKDVLARAWLNSMTLGEHNERCLDQADAGMDCPVAAEVVDFVPKIAEEYARLRSEGTARSAATTTTTSGREETGR